MNPDLLWFNTWRETRPEGDGSGLVISANDHGSKSCTVWWAGPRTEFVQRMTAAADSRGINLIVIDAAYSLLQIHQATDLIWAAEARLRGLRFELQAVEGPSPDFIGLTVKGSPFGDAEAQNLSQEVIAAVRNALDHLLRETGIAPRDVRVEYGRVYGLV